MKHIHMAVTIVLATLAAAIPALSAETSSGEEKAIIERIKQLENERIQAGVRKDTAWLAAATADEYTQIDWDGKVLDKAATLARIRSNNIQLQSNTLDEISVKVYGNIAVVAGMATRKGAMDGKDISTSVRYTRVYVNRDGRWQVTQFQQTQVTSAARCRQSVRRNQARL